MPETREELRQEGAALAAMFETFSLERRLEIVLSTMPKSSALHELMRDTVREAQKRLSVPLESEYRDARVEPMLEEINKIRGRINYQNNRTIDEVLARCATAIDIFGRKIVVDEETVSRALAAKIPKGNTPDPCVMDPEYDCVGTNYLDARQMRALLEQAVNGPGLDAAAISLHSRLRYEEQKRSEDPLMEICKYCECRKGAQIHEHHAFIPSGRFHKHTNAIDRGEQKCETCEALNGR